MLNLSVVNPPPPLLSILWGRLHGLLAIPGGASEPRADVTAGQSSLLMRTDHLWYLVGTLHAAHDLGS